MTALGVAALAKTGGGRHADGGGLYLDTNRDRANWVFRYRIDGRLRCMGLGPLHTVSLAEARQKALAARKLRLEGFDPIEERRKARLAARIAATRGITFKACAEAYIGAHSAGWKNPKHAAQWPATLGAYAYPVFGDLPVAAIDTALVMKALDPLWTAIPETASRVRGRIEAVLDWAAVRGYREGENPARWRGHLDKLLPARSKIRRVEHHAALPYDEIGAFMAALRRQDGNAARALEFAILTAARTGEVIGARWEEIDPDGATWTVPAERMKSGQAQRVPLSAPAMAILGPLRQARSGPFVFPGGKTGRPLSDMALLQTMRRMGRGDLTTHGFRSTFRDWVAEQTNFPREIAEKALAHAVGDKVEAAYQRGDLFDKRRRLMAVWGTFCAGPERNAREGRGLHRGARRAAYKGSPAAQEPLD